MRKEQFKKGLKVAGWTVLGTVGVASLAVIAFVLGNKPDVVENPCFRSTHRADGTHKKPFDKAWRANLQSVEQLVRFGEVCNAYQVGELYYTGHSKDAICRNINPFK